MLVAWNLTGFLLGTFWRNPDKDQGCTLIPLSATPRKYEPVQTLDSGGEGDRQRISWFLFCRRQTELDVVSGRSGVQGQLGYMRLSPKRVSIYRGILGRIHLLVPEQRLAHSPTSMSIKNYPKLSFPMSLVVPTTILCLHLSTLETIRTRTASFCV